MADKDLGYFDTDDGIDSEVPTNYLAAGDGRSLQVFTNWHN